MSLIDKIIGKIDAFQRTHKPTAFLYAVVKKFSDDQAGYQAALVTYYGFLSLFPLLLILNAVASIISRQDPALANDIIQSVSNYFPTIGQQLQDSVSSTARSGWALVIGIILSLYGARGIANAFRNAVNHIWHVPLAKRSGFPRSQLRNVSLIIGGGAGFVTASAIAGWAAAVGHGGVFRVVSLLLNLLILYLVFIFIFRAALSLKIHPRQFRVGAVICAVGVTILQTLGSYVLANITPSSYSTIFATTLGLLAWIYLQAQVVMYAVEVDTVRDGKLLPRSLSGKNLTPADTKMAHRLGAAD